MDSSFKMSETQHFGAKYFPVLFASILFTATIISFIIALVESDITPWFPAISDTATKSPESNIFSQLVNISTFIGLILMYIRYLQVKRDVEWLEESRVTVVLNKYSLPIGLIAVLGCSIAANFPVSIIYNIRIISANGLRCYMHNCLKNATTARMKSQNESLQSKLAVRGHYHEFITI